jgi:hypothetical protein
MFIEAQQRHLFCGFNKRFHKRSSRGVQNELISNKEKRLALAQISAEIKLHLKH